MQIELFFRTVFLRYLLWRIFGVNSRPCNPYVGRYYTIETTGRMFTGKNKPEGSYRQVSIPNYGDNYSIKIKGVDHILSYSGGVITMFVGGEMHKKAGSKEKYNKIIYVLTKTQYSYEDGIFEYVGIHKGMMFMHFMDCREMLKSKNRMNYPIIEVLSTPYKHGFVCGNDKSFLSLILVLITTISSLISTLNVKEPKSEDLRGWGVKFCAIVIVFVSIDIVINLFESNWAKVFCYRFYLTWVINFIDYRRSILNHKKYCMETAGNPVRCKEGDFYLILKKCSEGQDFRLDSYALNQNNFKNKCTNLIARQLHKFATNDAHPDHSYKSSDYNNLIKETDRECYLGKFNVHNCSVEVIRDKTLVTLKMTANSVFNNKTKEYTKTMCSQSFNTLLSILQCSSYKADDKKELEKLISSGVCNRLDLGVAYLSEMEMIKRGLGSGCYFRPDSAGDSGPYRHCMSFKDLMETLSSDSFGFRLKVNNEDSWVLGPYSSGTCNGISGEDLEIIISHNKIFFGEEKMEAIWEMNNTFQASTLKGLKCSQWKKYQVEYCYIIKELGYNYKRPLDTKRYKCSPWVHGFLAEKIKNRKGAGIDEIMEETVATNIAGETFVIREELKKESYLDSMSTLSALSTRIPEIETLTMNDVLEKKKEYFDAGVKKELSFLSVDLFKAEVLTIKANINEKISKLRGVESMGLEKKKEIKRKIPKRIMLEDRESYLNEKKSMIATLEKEASDLAREIKKKESEKEEKDEWFRRLSIYGNTGDLVWGRKESEFFKTIKVKSAIRSNVFNFIKKNNILLAEKEMGKLIELMRQNSLDRNKAAKIIISRNSKRDKENLIKLKDDPMYNRNDRLKELIDIIISENEAASLLTPFEHQNNDLCSEISKMAEKIAITDLGMMNFQHKVYSNYFNFYYNSKKKAYLPKKRVKEAIKLKKVRKFEFDKEIVIPSKRQKCPVFLTKKTVGVILLSLLITGCIKQSNEKIFPDCNGYRVKKAFRRAITNSFK